MSAQTKPRRIGARSPRHHGGFSLLELILVIVILGAIAGVLAQPIVSITQGLLAARSHAEAGTELYSALDRISRAARGAEAVACDGDRLTVTNDGVDRSFFLSGDRVRMEIDGADAGAVVGSGDAPMTAFSCAGAASVTGGERLYELDRLYRITIEHSNTTTAETVAYNR